MTIRGEISDPLPSNMDLQPLHTSRSTVTVSVDIKSKHAKKCLDLLLSAAHDFSMQPEDPPF